jgi:PDZ domain
VRHVTAGLALFAVLTSCVASPPTRSSLPDVDEVLDPPVACSFLIGEPRGILVSEVLDDTAADGILEPGDVIVAVNGVGTLDTAELRETLDQLAVGDEIEVEILRRGNEETAALILGANPDDPDRVYIGVMIRTDYEQVLASEADDAVVASPTSRSLTMGGTLYGGDPTLSTWSNTGIHIETESNWVSTTDGVYMLESGGTRALMELTGGEEISYELTENWSPVRLIGSIDEDLLIAATRPVPDDPALVEVGLARFDPQSGETEWVVGIVEGFGVPISAWGSPGSGLIQVAGVEADTSEVTGVEILDADGQVVGIGDLASLGTPVGWLDLETALFRTSGSTVSTLNAATGATDEMNLDPSVEASPIYAVADGHSVLAVSGRSLVIDDLGAQSEVRVLAENCTVNRVGESGWAP